MIPLIGILLCIYLVFKGFEIFQIAWCTKDAPAVSIIIGIAAVVASVVIGSLFAFMFLSAGNSMPQLPIR
jgi:hypothetical protein